MSDEEIPEEARTLGPLREAFHFKQEYLYFAGLLSGGAVLGFVLAILIALEVIHFEGITRTAKIIIASAGVLALVGGVAFFVWEFIGRDRRILVLRDGLVHVYRGVPQICHWKDIQKVSWTHLDANGIAGYRLTLSSGPDVVFNSVYFRVEDVISLGRILREETERRRCRIEWTETV